MAVGGVYLCMQVVPVCGVFMCVYMQVVSIHAACCLIPRDCCTLLREPGLAPHAFFGLVVLDTTGKLALTTYFRWSW